MIRYGAQGAATQQMTSDDGERVAAAARAAAQIEIDLLGAPDVRRAGSVCNLHTRKALALLAFLASEGGLHPRATVVDLLWPAAGETRGRAVLRSTLYTLRDSLGPEGSDVLVAERDLLGLTSEAFSLDLRALEQARRLTLAPDIRADQPERLRALSAAVARVRGPFMEGFTLPDAPDFEAWVAARRTHWQGVVSHLYARLAEEWAAVGEQEQALAMAERWVQQTPLDEAAHRALMQAHLAAGDREGALRAYQACRELFAAELGASPSREAQALAGRIAATRPARPQPSAAAGAQLPEPPLVGRGSELQALRAAYHEVEAGSARLVVVAGEAGSGKTRLATEFLTWATVQGADVLAGRALETEGGLPYAPLLLALRERLERENAPEDLLEDVWLAELTRLLPELRERYPDLFPGVGDAGEARVRLFEAVARLLRALATRQPLALVLDDAQWVDGATRDLVRYLVQRLAGARLLVVLAVRAEDAALHPEIVGWLAGLARDVAARRLDLAPLTVTETRRLVVGLAAAGADNAGSAQRRDGASRLGTWIHAQTGGRPAIIVELLRALVEEGSVELHADDHGGPALDVPANWQPEEDAIPARIRALIGAQVAYLDSPAQQVLTAGALLGDGFMVEQICRAVEISERAAADALDRLVRAGLVEEGEPGCYTLTYALLRVVVRAQAGSACRQAIGRQMEARHGGPHALSQASDDRGASFPDQGARAGLRLLPSGPGPGYAHVARVAGSETAASGESTSACQKKGPVVAAMRVVCPDLGRHDADADATPVYGRHDRPRHLAACHALRPHAPVGLVSCPATQAGGRIRESPPGHWGRPQALWARP
jgi:DNA-binding SARP family transcriptional activator